MKQTFIITSLSLTAFLFSCKDDSLDLSSYTARDMGGVLTGAEDPTDWKLQDNWNQQETALFENAPQLVAGSDTISINPMGYPNPTTGVFNLNFNVSSAYLFSLRVVDKDMTEIIAIDSASANSPMIVNLEALGTDAESYRVYYYLMGENGNVYRGHGDIMMAQ